MAIRPARIGTEDFDPRSADVYLPISAVRPSGVASNSGFTKIIGGTRIKTPRGLFTMERSNQQHAESRTDVIIEIVKYGGAEFLPANAVIMHAGQRYDVIGKNDMTADGYRKQTVKYQCRVNNSSDQSLS